MGERSSLEHLNHPFIVGLRYCFADSRSWYLVMDYFPGGDVFEA
jgi:serine/threonine protein kinase